MSDIVNKFFHRHYPADAGDWKYEAISSIGGRKYQGARSATIFPLMVCADGFSMSVQGHFGAYSYPRDDFADEYAQVEVYEVSEPEPLLNDHENSRRYGDRNATRAGMDEPAGYVPISVIEAIIAKHGGLAP